MLESIHDLQGTDEPLSKYQRLAVKHWYHEVCSGLKRKISDSTVHTTRNAKIRSELIDCAIEVVDAKFQEMEELLDGKEWSKRPQRWDTHGRDGWRKELEKLF